MMLISKGPRGARIVDALPPHIREERDRYAVLDRERLRAEQAAKRTNEPRDRAEQRTRHAAFFGARGL